MRCLPGPGAADPCAQYCRACRCRSSATALDLPIAFSFSAGSRARSNTASALPGAELVSGPVQMHLQHDRPEGREAYDRLIGDALRGDPSLFARSDSVLEAWRIVDGALLDPPPVRPYRRGGWGPDEANQLLHGGLHFITR